VIAIEDSAMGLVAATAVGIPVVVTRSLYFADDAVPGALAVGPMLGTRAGWEPPPKPGLYTDRIGLGDLRAWRERRGA
jgi:hypothetical protein